MISRPKQILQGGATSIVALSLVGALAPVAAIAAPATDEQGASASQAVAADASATSTEKNLADPAVNVVISDVTDDSAHLAITGRDARVNYQETYVAYRKSGEPAPAKWTADTFEDLGSSDGWADLGQTAYDGLRTVELDLTHLDAGTTYVVYVESIKAFSDDDFGFTDIAKYEFTTTGIGVDSVTNEISALVSEDFNEGAVKQARADYDSLGDKKAGVKNVDVLTAAEAVVTARAQAADAQAGQKAAEEAQARAEAAQAKAEKALADYKAAHPVKKANTLKATAAKKTVEYKAVKKKAQKVAIKAAKAQGKVTFAKAKKTGIYKKASVSKKGVVTLKKGAKKGTYSFKVTAAGNAKYNAKTVTVKIKVK